MLQNEHSKLVLICVLLPNVVNEKTCHAAVTNNWITLNVDGKFNVCNNLDINKF